MKKKTENSAALSRRQFLGGASALAAATTLGFTGLTGCAPANTKASVQGSKLSFNYLDTVSWNTEYDVVVVGWGGAGSVAAITAAEQGAKVLIVEKAPYGDEGGNTRYCEQYFLIPKTYDDGVQYFKSLAAGFDTATDEIIDFMAKGTMEIEPWLKEHGAKTFNFVKPEASPDRPPTEELRDWSAKLADGSILTTEYPTWPDGQSNGDRIQIQFQVDSPDDEKKKYWNLLRTNIVSLKDSIDVWYESPALQIIQDPFNKTVLGVKVSKQGEEINVRAKNGVVLSCGSYEASQEMMETYAQYPKAYPFGTLYNTGDGIKMAESLGAEMWHMRAMSGPWMAPKHHNTDRGLIVSSCSLTNRITKEGNCFYVGGNAKRFTKEAGYTKHGHVNIGGTWTNLSVPETMWAIMDATARNGAGVIRFVDPEEIIEANTIEELASKINLNPAALVETTTNYNAATEAGVDTQFGRIAASFKPVETAPFYAVRLWPCFVNTQAGPRRNTNCEVVDNAGNPIPNLYSAGELGSMWAGIYVCGGNIAETVYSGRTAGANAAAPKQTPSGTELALEESKPRPLGNDLDTTEVAADVKLEANQYLGKGQGLHGTILAKVTVVDKKITAVEIVEQNETPDVTKDVWTALPAAMVASGVAQVDAITGATVASKGLVAAAEDAVAQAS